MKAHTLIICLVTSLILPSCVTIPTKEVTRTNGDEKTLQDSAILRPRNRKIGDLGELNTVGNITFVHDSILMPNASIRKGRYIEAARSGIVLIPGSVAIQAGSLAGGSSSTTTLRFEAKQGVIYRVKATFQKATYTQLWELYEEGSGKVLFRREEPAKRIVLNTILLQ